MNGCHSQILRHPFLLWVIHILAVKVHDVLEHVAGLGGGAVGVEALCLKVAVDGLVKETLPAVLVALPIKFVCGQSLIIHFFSYLGRRPHMNPCAKLRNKADVAKRFWKINAVRPINKMCTFVHVIDVW